MRLNGESAEQMAFVREDIKSNGGVAPRPYVGNDTTKFDDTSKDQVWDVEEESARTDRYVLITTAIWLGPKLLVMAPFMLLSHLPPMLCSRIYVSFLPDETERVVRSKAFYAMAFWALLLSIPAILLILISLIWDWIGYYIFSLLYCTVMCRWSQMKESQRKLDPYRNGPSIIRHWTDFFVCTMGQCARQSPGETLYMVSCMWLLMPWLKYYINCNPYIYDLQYRMVQQISTEMQDLGEPIEVAEQSRKIITWARQTRENAERIDLWSFVPHYPCPPPDRRWALGLQAGGANYPGKFTLIVHTTHAKSESGGSTEQFVLSNSCELPIYRVMLWHSNPFHFLTGWLEASVSTGEPSQPNKYRGGEHPMWLVTARNKQISHRDSWTGSGMIDAFFDFWLPVFVHEMRRWKFTDKLKEMNIPNYRDEAELYANSKYQEVHSEDGISRPMSFTALEKYEQKDALSQYRKTGKEQHKEICQRIGDFLNKAASTKVGQRIHKLQQESDDLHGPGGALEQREVFLAPTPVPDVTLREVQISEPHVQQEPTSSSAHAPRPAGTAETKTINAPTSLGRKWKAPQHPSTYTVMRDLEEAEKQTKALQELFRQPSTSVGENQQS